MANCRTWKPQLTVHHRWIRRAGDEGLWRRTHQASVHRPERSSAAASAAAICSRCGRFTSLGPTYRRPCLQFLPSQRRPTRDCRRPEQSLPLPCWPHLHWQRPRTDFHCLGRPVSDFCRSGTTLQDSSTKPKHCQAAGALAHLIGRSTARSAQGWPCRATRNACWPRERPPSLQLQGRCSAKRHRRKTGNRLALKTRRWNQDNDRHRETSRKTGRPCWARTNDQRIMSP